MARSPRTLPTEFYARPTLEVLEELIGKVLVHEINGRRVSGAIVEAEAYIGESDPACHAAPGPTKRNAPLYGPPARSYVYLNYGIHYLVNAVTEEEGSPAAVLIRALEPLEGISAMTRRRARPGLERHDLCRGPGNLTRALGISLKHNRLDLTSGRLRIEDHGIRPVALGWSTRVGISVGTERPWRCTWAEHASVSASAAPSRLPRRG